jgi:hypothetical protein
MSNKIAELEKRIAELENWRRRNLCEECHSPLSKREFQLILTRYSGTTSRRICIRCQRQGQNRLVRGFPL